MTVEKKGQGEGREGGRRTRSEGSRREEDSNHYEEEGEAEKNKDKISPLKVQFPVSHLYQLGDSTF